MEKHDVLPVVQHSQSPIEKASLQQILVEGNMIFDSYFHRSAFDIPVKEED